ncbi:hypothetical protein [Streptomyces sp. NPDC007856]|uniref:hypothetical protein n=1 Tax=Streptomyces sp. NPDC007856 TaxID=3364781 RepID=UPI003696C323
MPWSSKHQQAFVSSPLKQINLKDVDLQHTTTVIQYGTDGSALNTHRPAVSQG